MASATKKQRKKQRKERKKREQRKKQDQKIAPLSLPLVYQYHA